jgi:hypothetical protein
VNIHPSLYQFFVRALAQTLEWVLKVTNIDGNDFDVQKLVCCGNVHFLRSLLRHLAPVSSGGVLHQPTQGAYRDIPDSRLDAVDTTFVILWF